LFVSFLFVCGRKVSKCGHGGPEKILARRGGMVGGGRGEDEEEGGVVGVGGGRRSRWRGMVG